MGRSCRPSTCSLKRPPGPQRAPPPEAPRAGLGGSAAGPLGSETAMTPGCKHTHMTKKIEIVSLMYLTGVS